MRREAEEMMCGNEDSLQSLFIKTTHMYFGRAYECRCFICWEKKKD